MAFLLVGLWIGRGNKIEEKKEFVVPFSQLCKDFHYNLENPRDWEFCSSTMISNEQFSVFKYDVERFEDLYPGYLKWHGISWTTFRKPVLIIKINHQQINSHILCEPDCGKKVVARFFPQTTVIYIEDKALTRGELDLPHEMAHAANAEAGIYLEKPDEDLAYGFEQVFEQGE